LNLYDFSNIAVSQCNAATSVMHGTGWPKKVSHHQVFKKSL